MSPEETIEAYSQCWNNNDVAGRNSLSRNGESFGCEEYSRIKILKLIQCEYVGDLFQYPEKYTNPYAGVKYKVTYSLDFIIGLNAAPKERIDIIFYESD